MILSNLYVFFGSQELFEAVEQERKWRVTPSRNTSIFHHPALGDFGLQHVSYQLLSVHLYAHHNSTIYLLALFSESAVTHGSQ